VIQAELIDGQFGQVKRNYGAWCSSRRNNVAFNEADELVNRLETRGERIEWRAASTSKGAVGEQ
jgi:hypothetical protein